MRSKHTMVVSLATFLAMPTSFFSRPAWAQSSPVLKQAVEFRALSDSDMKVRDMRAAHGDIYFLVASRDNTKTQVRLLDTNGKLKGQIDVGNNVTGFSVTPSKGVVTQTVIKGNHTHRLDEYSSTGRLTRSREMSDGFVTFWSTGQAIAGFGMDRRLYALGEAGRTGLPDVTLLPRTFRLQQLDSHGNHVAVIDTATGNMKLIDIPSGQSKSLTINSPELEAARAVAREHDDRWAALPASEKLNRAPQQLAVVFATALDGKGDILLAAGTYKIKDGVPVIRVNQRGQVTGSFRFDLLGGQPPQPQGMEANRFTPLAMTVVADNLFVTDLNGRVVVYRMP